LEQYGISGPHIYIYTRTGGKPRAGPYPPPLTTCSAYFACQLLPADTAYLLQGSLRPDAAYFDAAVGVMTVDQYHDYEFADGDQRILWWDQVDTPSIPTNGTFGFGRLEVYYRGTFYPRNDTTSDPAFVHFDGEEQGSAVVWGDSFKGWDTSPSSEFTAVWIGRFSEQPSSDDETMAQAFLTLSRESLDDGNNDLVWTTQRTLFYSNDTSSSGAQTFTVNPPPASGEWTMEVLSRSGISNTVSAGIGDDGITMSYYRYGPWSNATISSWQFPGLPCSLGADNLAIGGDPLDDDRSFKGDVAAVLIYNRALSEADLRALASFYGPRFGWAPPVPSLPAPPAPPPPPPPPPPGTGPWVYGDSHLACIIDISISVEYIS
jgi:hypothetical protein